MRNAARVAGERRLLREISVHPWVPEPLRRMASRIERSPLAVRVASGAFWTFAGTALSRILALAGSMVTARLLGRESFGEVGVILSTIYTFQAFASFGLGLTATKFVAELRSKDPERAGRIMALSFVVSAATGAIATALLLAYAPWLAASTLKAPQLATPLRIGALALFFNTLGAAQTGALTGFEAFRTSTTLTAWSGALGVALGVVGIWLWGIDGVVWGQAAASMLQWLLTHFAVRRHAAEYGIRIAIAGWWRERSVLWTFSLPAVAAGVMVGPVGWATNAILVNQPHGYTEMGILNAANQWFGAVLFLPTAFAGALVPVLSERIGHGDSQGAKRVLRGALLLNAMVVVPIVLGGSVASPWIMGLYGPGFREAWSSLVVVLITAGIVGATNPVGNVLAASGKLWLGFLMNAGWAVLWLSGTALLIHWGALGVLWARFIAYIIHTGWTLWFAARFLRSGVQTVPSAGFVVPE